MQWLEGVANRRRCRFVGHTSCTGAGARSIARKRESLDETLILS
jgi:hypothetical protein